MSGRAPAIGWSALTVAAVVAACGPLLLQLAFAGVAIGVIGMAHGASDLAIVAPRRRPLFLACYGLVCLICLGWWIADPAVALPAFLLASAIHFAMEDAPEGTWVERVARGVSLIATPATLHAASLTVILQHGGITPAMLPGLVTGLTWLGGIAAAGLLALAIVRRDPRLFAGTAALLLLPPLIGFSLGFLILHALPQTWQRCERIGCMTAQSYLRAIAPVLGAAMLLVLLIGGIVWRWDDSGVRPLFAAIAALAMPHLLVTPWFEAGAADPVTTPARSVPV
ncbi:Brp/Blh family beta-carotene 15,15'-dioxygenase [Sphingomonas sp. RIT328]|uniref:Brp/Blh family beta-carotene 15,15'-dioxygenase n=1 Tax=Sphingomonas sp. RIT328 TaxID=1470591 RepID=UPI0004454E5D|nr:Brp/Blh family beta-carotene 15,15'-dioxygenase [Sphingomonas sp. RIT328]EZP53857.1 putative membrane protein [Sphingomonas sp. RIT328]